MDQTGDRLYIACGLGKVGDLVAEFVFCRFRLSLPNATLEQSSIDSAILGKISPLKFFTICSAYRSVNSLNSMTFVVAQFLLNGF